MSDRHANRYVRPGRIARPSATMIRESPGEAERPDPGPAPAPGADPPHPLLLAFWFGLLTGLLEVGLLLATKPMHDPSPGLFRMNRHLLWVVPAFNLSAFALVGLAAALVGRRWPALGRRLGVSLGLFLTLLTLLMTVRQIHAVACLILALGITHRLGPLLRARGSGLGRALKWTAPALAGGVLILFGLSLDREWLAPRRALASLPPSAAGAPNVLLVVLDTVRADHMSLHGYHRDTTPNLARLAGRGVRFDRAIAPAPWTLPSHASMFTGHWPHEHRAGLDGPLGDSGATLAEHLARHGYATAGFIANVAYCTAESGIARGFAHYEDHDLSPARLVEEAALGERLLAPTLVAVRYVASAVAGDRRPALSGGKATKDADRINADFLGWLSSDRPSGRPFFAFLNYFDAHHPYWLPDGVEAPRRFGPPPGSEADGRVLDRWWSLDKRALPDRQVALARDGYDTCIAYLDDRIGRLIDDLDRRGILDETLVIITSDHGEHFGEHDVFGHGASLYRGEIGVPLLILPPRNSPHAAAAGLAAGFPASLRDLPATVSDLLGLGGESPFPGRSLARYWTDEGGDSGGAGEAILAEIEGPARHNANDGRSPAATRGPLHALIEQDLTYIRGSDDSEELYDLRADPGESENLAGGTTAHPDLDRLRARLLDSAGVVPPSGAQRGGSFRPEGGETSMIPSP